MGRLLGKPRPLDSRNRVTLSAEVLDLLKLKPNDEVFFRLDNGKITMGKALVKYELIDEIVGGKKK
ncbi:MAG TPA: AbrB/MazE/SpoVT family DNA-binding domain-containing protein [Candidatus Thermoplasmatota archaeon]|nr:AbrB/MazE/SpoVT family DNA-binding domain-containing protein [Candidatus Thermoplasmatota archaeon]